MLGVGRRGLAGRTVGGLPQVQHPDLDRQTVPLRQRTSTSPSGSVTSASQNMCVRLFSCFIVFFSVVYRHCFRFLFLFYCVFVYIFSLFVFILSFPSLLFPETNRK